MSTSNHAEKSSRLEFLHSDLSLDFELIRMILAEEKVLDSKKDVC